MCFQKGLCCFEKSSSSRVHIAEHSMSSWEGSTPLVAKVSESLSVCLLFSMALFFSPFKEAVSWCKVRNSLDGIVPRNILLRSVMTCWVLRRKQVFSWHWRNPCPFWCSASCCDISVPMLGTPLGAMCLCAPCALSIHFSLSFSEKEWSGESVASVQLMHVVFCPKDLLLSQWKLKTSLFLFQVLQLLLTFTSMNPGLWAFWLSESPEPGETLLMPSACGSAQ